MLADTGSPGRGSGRAMSGYLYGEDEAFPDTPLHREYLEDWLTRVVPPEVTSETH